MELTEQELDIISKHPFHDFLQPSRLKLHDLVDADLRREDIASVLLALSSRSTASLLTHGKESLEVKLIALREHVLHGTVVDMPQWEKGPVAATCRDEPPAHQSGPG